MLMDKLLIIPVISAALYFLYRHLKRSLKGEYECHGNCASCSKEMVKKMQSNKLL
jgi:hypothetical protein